MLFIIFFIKYYFANKMTSLCSMQIPYKNICSRTNYPNIMKRKKKSNFNNLENVCHKQCHHTIYASDSFCAP